jgi:hypothetical protein
MVESAQLIDKKATRDLDSLVDEGNKFRQLR